MTTGVDKKRFIWLMILIIFFFANLILIAVVAINAMLSKPTPMEPMTLPAMSQPAPVTMPG